MSEARVDVVVVGAGINGVCIAKELADHGYRVAVLEAKTIGSGTSSKSSRLIHGGLRYLESLAQWGLVRESLIARQELCERYPDLVRLKPFYLPVMKGSPRPSWMLYAGLKLYDLFSGGRSRSSRVSQDRFQEIFPDIRSDSMKSVFSYYDGVTHDQALTERMAQDAKHAGAVFFENEPVVSIAFNDPSNAVVSTAARAIRCRVVVNATGPWIDEINALLNLPSRYHIQKVSGIHIQIDREIAAPLFLQAQYPRIFFMIPEGKTTIIGTTERAEQLPMSEIAINPADEAYLIEQANRYLKKPVNPSEIVGRWIGVRPLVASNSKLSRISRESVIDVHRFGQGKTLIHVFGGKLTTAVSLARRVRSIINPIVGPVIGR